MVRIIKTEVNKVHGSDHEGFFLDSTSYDEVIDEDCDVFDLEGNKVVQFRKGALTVPEGAFEAFKKAACKSKSGNRGLAAGRELERQVGGRIRMTAGQRNAVQRGKGKKGFSSYEEFASMVEESQDPSPYFWLLNVPHEQVWSELEAKLQQTPLEDWRPLFQEFEKQYVDAQGRGNMAYSNVFGAFGRTGRNPYCRLSAAAAAAPEVYERFAPFYKEIDEISRQAFPEKHAFVKQGLADTDPLYTLFGTMFTCITVNWNFRLASHFDGRNFDGGFATLTVFEKGEFGGHYLVFPEIRLAFNLREGDAISADTSTLLHGNTAKTGEGERVSLVFFTRQDIANKCHSSVLDTLRKEFWEYARRNLRDVHGNGRKGWSGVWKGMYDSPEWYAFLEERKYQGQLKEADKLTA